MSSTPFAVSFPNIPDAGTRHFETFAEAAAFVARAGFHAVIAHPLPGFGAGVVVARNGSMGGAAVIVPDGIAHLRRCAEGEGGRARLAIDGYANADTAAYFAREASHYASTILELGGGR